MGMQGGNDQFILNIKKGNIALYIDLIYVFLALRKRIFNIASATIIFEERDVGGNFVIFSSSSVRSVFRRRVCECVHVYKRLCVVLARCFVKKKDCLLLNFICAAAHQYAPLAKPCRPKISVLVDKPI